MHSRIGKTFVFGGLALGGALQQAVAATLAGFTFEGLTSGFPVTTASVGPLAAEVGSGSAFGIHAASTTVWSTPAGNGSARSLSANVWTLGDVFEFRTGTVGFEDIMVTFDHTRSSTGPNNWDFQYSTNGTTFTSFVSGYTLAGTGFSSGTPITATPGVNFSVDLSSVSALDNLATVYFRMKNNNLNSSGGSVATGGTSRLDNVFITGVEIPEPSSLALATVAAAAALTRRRRD